MNNFFQNFFQKIKNFFSSMTSSVCHHTNNEKFKNLKPPIHIIYFYKNECPHCKDFSKEIDGLHEKNFFANNQVKFYKVNVNENDVFDSKPTISDKKLSELKSKVSGVPMIFFLDNDEILLDMNVEGNDIQKFKDNYIALENALNKK
jgi:thiol-disulfide isomerase/thioredoxin